ncbi:hypothetical protein NSQ77_04475 [Oceanobacillus sp. FSL K6-2867]|uniref:hypothetical protein n=1 Tax=Oceanobacillus sp. FSL K6-2867 TaxID=2954748 RepID=UPI0030D76AA4
MKINKKTIFLHTIFSGIITFIFTLFMASGAISENYTNDTFAAPIFFVILAFWLVGVLYLIFKKLHIAIKMMWLSVPAGMIITFPIAMFI